MKINIWSDIRCPFCYIGKHKFEEALSRFPHKDRVEVIWRSFELDPHLKTRKDSSIFDYLAEVKGISREQAVQMNQRVEEIAHEMGLEMNIGKSQVANSFNGHRLIQLAKDRGLGAVAEEELFRAQFAEGKNIDDFSVLSQVGKAIGLDENELAEVFASDSYAERVKQDQLLAQSIGVRGVPFFVFDDRFAVSGAQSPEVFFNTMETAWKGFIEKQAQSGTGSKNK